MITICFDRIEYLYNDLIKKKKPILCILNLILIELKISIMN
jgi:hypothetical protein